MPIIKNLFLEFFLRAPIAFIGTFLLTPLLWQMEPIIGMELAGHSGPVDWMFELTISCTVGIVFFLLTMKKK